MEPSPPCYPENRDFSALAASSTVPVEKVCVDKAVQVEPQGDEVLGAIDIARFVANEVRKKKIPQSYKYPAVPYTSDLPCVAMARLVSELLVNHSILYTSMVNQLKPDVNNGYKSFKAIGDVVFENDTITWGRIISLYALEARVVMYLQSKHLDDAAMKFAYFAGAYVGEKAENWIKENGGWKAMAARYPGKNEMEGRIWKSLLLTGLGLGVAAAYLAAH